MAQALAPLAFGGCADLIARIAPEQAPVDTHSSALSPGAARGLEVSFLIMLTALIAAGVVLFRALRTYPRDVATAAASQANTRSESVNAPAGRSHCTDRPVRRSAT